MTSEPPYDDPDTEPLRKLGAGQRGERKRAALVLAVLAVAAIVLVGVLYAVSSNGGGTGSPGTTTAAIPSGPAVQVTGVPSQSASSSSAKPKPTKSPSTTPSSSARTGPVSCPTSAPCALPDDVGNVVKALNNYRAANGQKAVAGSVTKRAQTCAVGSGDTSSCPSGYYWEPVGRSGAQVVQKVAANGKGKAFLLDKAMTAIEVGWAYIPSSHSFECALIAAN